MPEIGAFRSITSFPHQSYLLWKIHSRRCRSCRCQLRRASVILLELHAVEERGSKGPQDPNILKNLPFSKHTGGATKWGNIESQIEGPGDFSSKTLMEEREREGISEEAGDNICSEKGHAPDKECMLKFHATALKHEETITAEISEETGSEVLASSSSDTGSPLTKENMGIALPSVMLSEAGVLELENSATDMPELLLSGVQEAGINSKVPRVVVEPALSGSVVPMKDMVAEVNHDDELHQGMAEESELQVSNSNGLSAFAREELHTFYEEKEAGVSSISTFWGTSTISPHISLQNNNNVSLPVVPGKLLEVKASANNFSHARGVLRGEVPHAFSKNGSASKRKESFKTRGFLRDARPIDQNVNWDLSRSPRPNGIPVKGKSDPSEFLNTYNRLLRDGRLIDCIELLESMERKGLLDMDKIYHARFLKTCKSKKAVKEAFRFAKLIKKPTLSTFNMLLSVCASSQDSEGAFRVLLVVKKAGLQVDCKLYTTLISTCAKTGKVDAMFEVFHEMVNAGVEPNIHTYGALIDGCARAGQVAKAFGAYGIMRSKKVKPDRVIFNALITACGQSGAVDRAFDVLAEMRAEPQPIDPDHVTVGALMKTCVQAGQIDRAREVYKMIHLYNIKGTPDVYTIAVNSCSQTGDLEFALSVYSDMKRNGVVPDEMFISALIDVAGHAGKVDFAFEILQGARSQGIQLGNISYSSLMGACSNGKNWQKASELYEDIRVLEMTPTVSTLNALITSLCDGDQLQKSVEVLMEMREAGVCPNAITYSVLLVACEKKDELELGFKLLSQAKEDGVSPNLVMCRCLTGLCLRKFEKASSLGEPVLSFNSGKPQLENKWTSWALMVYRETIAAGVVPSMEVFSHVLGCLQLPHDTSLRNRLTENLGVKSEASRHSNLCSLLDGFGEYDPRSFSLLEEAASLGIIPCVSFRESPIIFDARKLEIHTAKVYLLTILKGLRHRLAAGAKLPNISILLQIERTRIISSKGDKAVNLAGRVGQAVSALLRRLGVPYQGKESLGKIRISGLALKRWFQPKLVKLTSPFDGKPAESSSLPTTLARGITNQQRSIRSSNLSLEGNQSPSQPPKTWEGHCAHDPHSEQQQQEIWFLSL
ncbi:pentatricopeptide repeat-containing protein MRL1, chloroplastic isoform X2 [Magnolia sinica]|uniref:pentatricopeptide repeat-containing protein MRL1, chloroplastic isoform X2 n=1 Tax=Magnolia sinica TaxID=86752 RepID=UPI002657BD91|nr:pentatricopeptide repeat-containing protein MRL1, chloroplastic isoform X2 [Magnolia sinica]